MINKNFNLKPKYLKALSKKKTSQDEASNYSEITVENKNLSRVSSTVTNSLLKEYIYQMNIYSKQ